MVYITKFITLKHLKQAGKLELSMLDCNVADVRTDRRADERDYNKNIYKNVYM